MRVTEEVGVIDKSLDGFLHIFLKVVKVIACWNPSTLTFTEDRSQKSGWRNDDFSVVYFKSSAKDARYIPLQSGNSHALKFTMSTSTRVIIAFRKNFVPSTITNRLEG